MHHLDEIAFRTTGQWQRQQFPDDLSDSGLLHMTETMLLASRVFDEEVRKLADQLRERVTSVGMSPDQGEADIQMVSAGDIQRKLINRIGQLVREMDEADK